MGETVQQAILATIAVSLTSLLGVFTLYFKQSTTKKIAFYLVAFSAGVLLGGAFLHLLPEAIESQNQLNIFLITILGIVGFFMLENYLKWRHCHEDDDCEVHTFTYMNLIGDGIHNFIDGLIIGSSFVVSFDLGLITTIVVALHEIPQELGDFGVLVHGGFSVKKALTWNFLSAITAVLGGVVGVIASGKVESLSSFFVALAAGGFIYISLTDLVPEIHRHRQKNRTTKSLLFFIAGLIIMFIFKVYF